MANKTTSMSKVRQIIKYYIQGLGKKKIAGRLGMSKHTVKLYVEQYKELKVPWNELSKVTDFELNKLFHPVHELPLTGRLKQAHDFYPIMEKQLRRRGMTLAIQYEVFRIANPGCYGKTAFYVYYCKWKKKVSPSMHIEHKVGDKVYVDFAGETLPYVDVDTGEIKDAQVFVAILGWSQYVYMEAMKNQTIEEFITACENALHYFQGVPLAIVPDNLKSAVFKANKYEPTLSENFKAFTDHYGIAPLAARPYKPKDKALVEGMVKISYQRVNVRLPENEILPLTALNEVIMKNLGSSNDTVLTGRTCSRTDQWIMELPSLQPLPATRYEMRTIKQVTVMKNGYIYLTQDQHYYSVPYELIGKHLKVQYSRSTVEIYDKYELIATHKRLRSPNNYSVNEAHRSPEHRHYMEWSPAFFMERAKAIDPVVEYYISQILAKKQHTDQTYKSCQGVLSLAKRVGNARLIKACQRAHTIGYYNYKTIDDILARNLDSYEDEPEPPPMPTHDNIRGGNYYK